MTPEEMQKRTREFALRVIRLVRAIPKDSVGGVLGRQLLRSVTAIGANYHEAHHASSRRHFISTMEIAKPVRRRIGFA